MFEYEQVGTDVRPPWWRTALFVLAAGFLSLFSLVFSPLSWAMQHGGSGSLVLLTGLAMLVAVGLPVILVWHHRFPFATTFVSAGASLMLPLGNALPLLGLTLLIGRRRGPAVWWTTAFVAVTSTWVVVLDSRAQPRGASFWKAWFGPVNGDPAENIDLSPLEVGVVILAGLVLSIGAGLLVRSRREAASAKDAVQAERAASGRLGDEVARRQERERIAREVHDAMGHRLSLLSLHAGALEANVTDDPRVAHSARLVRESANAAMDDLRSLLDVLREPVGAEPPPVPLSELAKVVQESFGAGQSLSSSIFIQDPESAHPTLTRAVYRIVQEVLTNARKHAPGEHVVLTVEGSPASGVVMDASNRYTGGWRAGTAGSSRGLAGISERAELLGGTTRYGLEGDMFRVHVELPWRAV